MCGCSEIEVKLCRLCRLDEARKGQRLHAGGSPAWGQEPVLWLLREGLRITQRFQCVKWGFAKKAAAFALTMLPVVGEVEEADAIGSAGIGEMC